MPPNGGSRRRPGSSGPPCVCGKTVFATQAAAVGAALRASRRSGDALRVYRCPENDAAWHLTKKPRWNDRARIQSNPPQGDQ